MEDTWELVELEKEKGLDSANYVFSGCGVFCNGGTGKQMRIHRNAKHVLIRLFAEDVYIP